MGPMYIEIPNISGRVISSNMVPMYIETPYIIYSRVISSHMGPMFIEIPNIISRVISSHMAPMYIETPNIIKSRVFSSHMGSMYIETPYNISSRVISSHMGPVYIEIPYIITSRVISNHMGPVYIETPCSTMGVGRQSRRVCFGAKPDKGFLDKKISPYPEVVRGRERELTTRPRRGVGSWTGERRVGGWRAERRQLRLDRREANREVGVDPRRGSQHQTPSREARRQDRVQWRRVSRCLIPVALWNFR